MEAFKVYDSLWAPDGYVIMDLKLIKLVNSKTVKRLSSIGQNGPLRHKHSPNGIIMSTTRYMHSIGTMILTLMVGGTVDEAIAALLHDIIHTAFSHAFDFIVNSSAVSYHEKHKDRLLEQFKDELEGILGSKWKRFLNDENWPLIKKNNPFAIDIADYTVRDGVAFKFCTENEGRMMAKCLSIDKNRHLITTNIETSNWWKELSHKTNEQIYVTPWNFAMNYYLSMAIKETIDNGYLTIEQLEKVNDCDIEKNALSLALNTISGQMFSSYDTFNWEFFTTDRDLESKWTKVDTFDIRWRIVNPPIEGIINELTDTKSKFDKYILAYTHQ